MFNRIRQIHLFTAFILTAFILMYFITGFVMIFEETFLRKDRSVSTRTVEIPGIHERSGYTLISALKEHFSVRGQYQIRKNQTGTIVNFRHPGSETIFVMEDQSDSVTATISEKNLISTLHQFHRLHGYNGGWNYQAWAFVYDLSALSMIVFALSGFYLWYRTERTRWPGWLIIIALTLFTAFTLFYLGNLH